MKGFKVSGFGQLIFAQRGLEVGERSRVGLALAGAPLHEEADDQRIQRTPRKGVLARSWPEAVEVVSVVKRRS